MLGHISPLSGIGIEIAGIVTKVLVILAIFETTMIPVGHVTPIEILPGGVNDFVTGSPSGYGHSTTLVVPVQLARPLDH